MYFFTLDYPANFSAGANVTMGPDFVADSNGADYYMTYTESIKTLYIQMNATNRAYKQTVVGSVPKVLAHVQMQIANACQSGYISFDPSIYICHYVVEDSTYVGPDSTIYDSIYSQHLCPYQCNPYPCNEHCCDIGDTDAFGNCNDSCWDSCYHTCYDTCYDTAKIVHRFNVYSYSNYTTFPYSNVLYDDSIPLLTCPPVITSLTNPVFGNNSIAAGTNRKSIPANSSILTINGTGFGSSKGAIEVTDANQGIPAPLDSTDILSWSENLIKVKMPDYLYGDSLLAPGTGPIAVYSSCGGLDGANLQINYNIENARTNIGKKLRPDIVMANDTESIEFHCDTSVANNSKALACVKKALRTWNCYTGVNWKLGSTVIEDISYANGVSVIYFNNSNFADTNTLMLTYPWTFSCADLSDSIAYYDEADIEMKRNQYLPSNYHWSYDTTYRQTSHDSVYFYDDILHELGHAHGLGHINDSASLMYRYEPVGQRDSITSGNTYPGPASLLGALDMINTSTANSPACSYHILQTDTRECIDHTLSVPDISGNTYNLNLYPNPVNGLGSGEITVSYQLSTSSYVQFKIIDCLGREVVILDNEHQLPGSYKEQINTTAFVRGAYLFIANINGSLQTIKFIKI